MSKIINQSSQNPNDKNYDKPKAYIFAGVNGAGKTTLYYDKLEQGKHFGLRINIDEIVSSFGDWREQKDQFRASKIALKIRTSYIAQRQNFNQETTLCGKSIITLFDTLKKAGYEIYLYYVALNSVNLAKERVAMRVKKGGHNIKPHLIERRYAKSLQNLKKITPLCEKVEIFDNSQNTPKDTTSAFRKITDMSYIDSLLC